MPAAKLVYIYFLLLINLKVSEEYESFWNMKLSSHKSWYKGIKCSRISLYTFELTFLETIRSLLRSCAVIQHHTMTEIINLTECFKHSFIKSFLFKLPNMYSLIPMGHTKHTFIAKECFEKKKMKSSLASDFSSRFC